MLTLGVRVTEHALERFLERHAKGIDSEDSARSALTRTFHHAKEVRFTSSYLENRFAEKSTTRGRYFLHSGMIFVCSWDPPPVVITVYPTEQLKIGKQLEYVDN